MDGLKPLEAITEVDPRQRSFSVIDPKHPEGLRDRTLADLHQAMVRYELPETVSVEVRCAFDVARNLWVFGWYYWPFHSASVPHALTALDLALGLRIEHERGKPFPRGKKPSLRTMLDHAIQRRWLIDPPQVSESAYEWSSGEGLPQSSAQSPQQADDQELVKRLAKGLPWVRDTLAHPTGYYYTGPRDGYTMIRRVHDFIRQLSESPSDDPPSRPASHD